MSPRRRQRIRTTAPYLPFGRKNSPGVVAAAVNPPTQQARIEYVPGLMDTPHLAAVIENAGCQETAIGAVLGRLSHRRRCPRSPTTFWVARALPEARLSALENESASIRRDHLPGPGVNRPTADVRSAALRRSPLRGRLGWRGCGSGFGQAVALLLPGLLRLEPMVEVIPLDAPLLFPDSIGNTGDLLFPGH